MRGRNWVAHEGPPEVAALKVAIRRELKADGCTQKDLADYLGITPKHCSQVLTGKVAGTTQMLAAMAAAVGLSLGVTRGGDL